MIYFILVTIYSFALISVGSADINSYPWPDKVTQYSGYITVNKILRNQFFYWFFESRSKPSQDPLLLWLTGGPGCSSSLALLAENGPFTMPNGVKTPVYNKNSWNSFSNLLYVDQPVGTGFSYPENPLGIETNEKTISRELTVFLEEFYEKYPKYAKLPLYIMGESYAGHFIPAFSACILNNSPTVTHNLKGIGIGNGWVDPKQQYPAYTEFMLDIGYITQTEYERLNKARDDCEALIDRNDVVIAAIVCNNYRNAVLATAEHNLGRTICNYDVRIPCAVPPLCYNFSNINTFMNTPEVQTSLGVNRPWTVCNHTVHAALLGDVNKEFETDVALTLEKGVKVLVYSGKVDYICNYKGGLAWTSAMNWPGKSQFNAKSFIDWNFNGKKVGASRSYSNLTFLEVENAGHLVPHDQPEVALEMLQQFLSGKLFS